MFGMVDAGVTYVSNEGGHANVKFDDGIYAPNLVGLRGNEDLGGGNSALFELSSQFAMGTGEFIGNGMFSRTAFVGFRNDRAGTVTVGYQYDFMPEVLFFGDDDAGSGAAVGLYNFRNGPFLKLALPNTPSGSFDWDRLGATQRVPSTVKYLSPSLDGLTFGAMYGFRDPDSTTGLVHESAIYRRGRRACNHGHQLGGGCSLCSRWTGNGRAVHIGAKFRVGRSSLDDRSGGAWNFTQALTIGINYMYMKGNAQVDDNHAHQINASLEYALSRRTAVYVSGVYQRASSGGYAQIAGVLDPDGASSGQTQEVARIGVHTAF